MFAVVLLELPDSRASQLREHVAYLTGSSISLSAFLQNRLSHFQASFGPDCVASVVSQGLGDAPEVSCT
jgi:hypothetical protein